MKSARGCRMPLCLLGLYATAFFVVWAALAVASAEESKPSRPNFIRFVNGLDRAALQVAHTIYLNARGTRVDLVGAVHVGDARYYRDLNKQFARYDAVLFELVGDPEDLLAASPADGESPHALRLLQTTMSDVLALEFQLDGIDYSAKNFVHADLTAKEFVEMQEERGESFFTLFLAAMRAQLAMQANQPPVGMYQLVRAFTSGDRASALKLIVAEQLAQAETLIGAMEEGNGSVLLSGRNEHVMKILQERVDEHGDKNLAIFFGAGHCEDLERRILDLKYQCVGRSWLTAWDIPKERSRLPTPSVSNDGALDDEPRTPPATVEP